MWLLELGWFLLCSYKMIFNDMSSGLDASISWESDRAENVGIHFINETITIIRKAVLLEISDIC
jgi:hypothetical protein